MGRPVKVLGKRDRDKILNRILKGWSLARIGKDLGVSTVTMFKWCHIDEAMEADVAQARIDSALLMVEKAQDIADDDSRDLMVDPGTGKIMINTSTTTRDKMRINQLNKRAAINDAKYGDKSSMDFNVGGNEGFLGLSITFTPPEDSLNILPVEEDNKDNNDDD